MFLGKIATPVGTSTRSTLEWTPRSLGVEGPLKNGLVIYFLYSRNHNRLATERDTGL